jgi:hypothetical protein
LTRRALRSDDGVLDLDLRIPKSMDDLPRVRRAILEQQLGETNRVEIEREEMLAEAQLALNAGQRHGAAAARDWLRRALARADDLRTRANGVTDKEQLDVLWLAAELTVSLGRTLVADLPKRIEAASAEMAA